MERVIEIRHKRHNFFFVMHVSLKVNLQKELCRLCDILMTRSTTSFKCGICCSCMLKSPVGVTLQQQQQKSNVWTHLHCLWKSFKNTLF